MQTIWSTLNAIWNEACLHSLACVALSVSISPFLSLFPCLWTAASQAIAKSLFSCSHSWFQLPSFATIIQHCCHTVCVCVSQTHITSHTTVRSQPVSQSVGSDELVLAHRRPSAEVLVAIFSALLESAHISVWHQWFAHTDWRHAPCVCAHSRSYCFVLAFFISFYLFHCVLYTLSGKITRKR